MQLPEGVVLANPDVTLDDVHPSLLSLLAQLAIVHKLAYNEPITVVRAALEVRKPGSTHPQFNAVKLKLSLAHVEVFHFITHFLSLVADTQPLVWVDLRNLGGDSHISLEWYGA